MGYKRRFEKGYSAQRRWVARAFRNRVSRIKRFVVHYEAIVNGVSVVDRLLVLASSEKDALAKAQNMVKSFHPKAKGVMLAIQEERQLQTWKPRGNYGKLIEKSNQYWRANRRE